MTTSEQNLASSRDVMLAFASGDTSIAGRAVASDFVGHDALDPAPIRGAERLAERISLYHDAFPDMRMTIETQLAQDELVCTRWSATGTHTGDLAGIAATGKQARVDGITIDRFDSDGRIVESHNCWSALGLLQQLGVVPTNIAEASLTSR